MLKQFRATVPFFSQMVYRALLPETVSTYDRLLVSVTLEKREGACALFVQKTPDMFTNLPSARKTLLEIMYCESRTLHMHFIFVYFVRGGYHTKKKMHTKSSKQVRESAAASNCTKISCVRKVGDHQHTKI